ncbi:enoyl-CoA hydratase/isomerase family protein [Vibrio splendidus]|uniref:Enoyl-CoA hydratase/isomerase family protein n=1 Tax=Vibrio splendidus TaxID=29497 RepID=A0A2T5EX46_VIBSP|nr:enoyl-CoA hydratase/isomerase family protein [Vibrio splendidus]PTP36622.1 enoyl-CoA hydratase/isomerase family protein [Vibrio splendidus]
MAYQGYTTFKAQAEDGILTVTFDFGTVNVQGQEMFADLNGLAMRLERDRDIKVVVFQSANPEIWVCHYDTNLLKDMSTEAVSREEAKLLDLQVVLERISKLPQATIAKLEGFARGGGHEFALACDMRFAARGKYKFMQMEVGMGILPCGGGASRMARQVGLGRALEIVLSARDFDADEAEALKAEAYWLYQATSKTPAVKRFQIADDQGLEHDMENQRNWETLVMNVQDIK